MEIYNYLTNNIQSAVKYDVNESIELLISNGIELNDNDKALINKIWELGNEFKVLYYIDEVTKEKMDASNMEEDLRMIESRNDEETRLFLLSDKLLFLEDQIMYRIGGYVH